jgi:hypothetical protein
MKTQILCDVFWVLSWHQTVVLVDPKKPGKPSKARPKAYGIADGGGLTLWITPDDHRYWHFRYRIGGKQPRISLGTYPAVSLQQARERAAECRALVANGIDPRKKRRDEKHRDALVQINTFKAAAEYWYKHKAEAGRATATLNKIRTYLDKDILPELGDKPPQHITHADCAKLQERIERRDAHNVAKKTRGWLKQIFSQAIARGLCENNPASELRAIAAAGPAVKHHPHLLEPALVQMACLAEMFSIDMDTLSIEQDGIPVLSSN